MYNGEVYTIYTLGRLWASVGVFREGKFVTRTDVNLSELTPLTEEYVRESTEKRLSDLEKAVVALQRRIDERECRCDHTGQ